MSVLLASGAAYTEQAQVTNWPARIAWVLVVLALIALALWGMRKGWVNRQRRQADLPAPLDAPPAGTELTSAGFTPAVSGLYAGSGVHGDWMDRIAVHDLGVRSRATISWGDSGIWLDRDAARSVFIPRDSVVGIRSDRGVAGTVRGRDSMVVITWHLGDRTLDTGFRADESEAHASVLDGLMAAFSTGVQA